MRGYFVRRCLIKSLDRAGLRLVRVRVDPGYPIDLIYLNRSKDMLLAEELATSGSLSNTQTNPRHMPVASRPTEATAREPARPNAAVKKASGSARRAERTQNIASRRSAAIKLLEARPRGPLRQVRGTYYRQWSRACRHAFREDSLRDYRWEIYRRDRGVDVYRKRRSASDVIACAYKAYAFRQTDLYRRLTKPRSVPISWVAEDGLVVPVYADGEDDRAERAELDGFLGMLSLAGLAIHPRGWLQPHPHHDGVCLTNDGDDSDSADLHAGDDPAAPSRADAC